MSMSLVGKRPSCSLQRLPVVVFSFPSVAMEWDLKKDASRALRIGQCRPQRGSCSKRLRVGHHPWLKPVTQLIDRLTNLFYARL